MDWISIITSLSYALYYPLYYALYSLVFLLSFLATLLRMLATPLLLFGGYLLHVSLFPFRVLEKFEVRIIPTYNSSICLDTFTWLLTGGCLLWLAPGSVYTLCETLFKYLE